MWPRTENKKKEEEKEEKALRGKSLTSDKESSVRNKSHTTAEHSQALPS